MQSKCNRFVKNNVTQSNLITQIKIFSREKTFSWTHIQEKKTAIAKSCYFSLYLWNKIFLERVFEVRWPRFFFQTLGQGRKPLHFITKKFSYKMKSASSMRFSRISMRILLFHTRKNKTFLKQTTCSR